MLSEGLTGKVVSFITGLSPENITKMGKGYEQLYSYVSAYAILGMIAMVVGIIAMLLSPVIKKRMEGIN